MENKTLTCSMTRANKLLAQLREGPVVGNGRRSRYCSSCVYHKEVSLLGNYGIEERLNEVLSAYNDKLTKKKLVEKWKSRLFELNVRYGISKVLSEIELLQQEKNMITEVLEELDNNNCVSLASAKVSMDAVQNSDKKYEFKWNVSPFSRDNLKVQLNEIARKLSNLDDTRDKLNIENSFSIELNDAERRLLNL